MNISINDKSKTQSDESIEKLRIKEFNNEMTNKIPFTEVLSEKINENIMNIEDSNELPDIDFNYETVSMDIDDAMFFINLAQNEYFSMQTDTNGNFQNMINTQINQNLVTQKTVKITNDLSKLIEKAGKSPVRISFDNGISVVLKIDKNGKVSAEFIPGSMEAQNYLMNNISVLKQKFDEQNLPYTSLTYRQKNGKNRNKNERGEN